MKFLKDVFAVVIGACIGLGLVFGLDLLSGAENFDTYVDAVAVSTEDGAYYQQLTDYQKAIYQALLPAVAAGENKVKLMRVNGQEFQDNCYPASLALQYDHPEFFWYGGGYELTTTIRFIEDFDKVTVKPGYYQYADSFFDHAQKQASLSRAVTQVANLARAHSQDAYEQMLFVHDYLVENAVYDHERLDDYYQTVHNPSCEYIFSAYGCLVDGRTVCAGYAKAYQLILEELGYECIYVTGEASEGPHGWNCVYLEDEAYYVDVTWDDQDYTLETPLYNYAFVDDTTLYRTHTVDTEFFSAPVCDSTKYDYYLHNGLHAELYQFDAAAEILGRQIYGNGAHIRFSSQAEADKAFDDLVKNGMCNKIDGFDDFRYASYHEKHAAITFTKTD